MRLTNASIEKLTYAKSDNAADLHFDDDLRGFGVRVFPSGRKAFFISYRNASGTKKRLTIGNYGTLNLMRARELARLKLADVLHGRDPSAEGQEKRREVTFADFCTRYEDFYKDRKRSWRDDAQRLRDHILPQIGQKKLSEITPTMVHKVHGDAKSKTSASTANRVVSLLRHVLNCAVKWAYLKESPIKSVALYREPPPRDIVLTPTMSCHQLGLRL